MQKEKTGYRHIYVKEEQDASYLTLTATVSDLYFWSFSTSCEKAVPGETGSVLKGLSKLFLILATK